MTAPLEKQVMYSVVIGGDVHNVTGRKRTKKGYIQLCIKSHPAAGLDGYVFEHRVVMEMFLQRYLDPSVDVHHKNTIKHDNRIENLEVLDHGKHTIEHNTGSKQSESTKKKISERAKERFKSKFNHPSYKFILAEELMSVLTRCGPKEAAKHFGVSRKTIYNKIEEFKLEDWYKNVNQSSDTCREIN